MKQWYFIEPQDVLMFRTAKPFAAGQSFVARSMFPPNPQTMQGALRACVIEHSAVAWDVFRRRLDEDRAVVQELQAQIGVPATYQGDEASLGSFTMQGPFVAYCPTGTNQVRRLIRIPLDVLRHKDDLQRYAILSPQELDFDTDMFDNWRPLGLNTPAEGFEQAAGWLDDAGFNAYLNGDLLNYLDEFSNKGEPLPILESSQVFMYDERVGLALDLSRRGAAEGMLYHAEFARPAPGIGLLVALPSGMLPAEVGTLNLGGEARTAHYRAVDYQPTSPQIQGNLKVVLLTPAYFEGGWQPANGDWSPWVGENATLVSMAIGRPNLISGWDAAKREPKPLYHYLPAGSVFYFENATAPTIPFTDTPNGDLDNGKLGFGAVAVGTW